MGRRRFITVVAIISTAVTAASVVCAQTGAPPAGPPPGPRPVVYPSRAVDPAAVDRGRVLYQQGCAACHGADIRGGSAPALHRSVVVLNDVRGETIGPFLAAGLPGHPDHVFKLERPQTIDIADYLHSIPVSGNGTAGILAKVPSILTGSATAGKAYFAKTCTSCHSATGDLAGVATRFGDPTTLQQRWLAPRAKTPITASVGAVSGEVTSLDEFSITLKTAQGERVIPRDGDRPKVVIKDPLAAHAALLRRITDDNIHDVTAYLVTLK